MKNIVVILVLISMVSNPFIAIAEYNEEYEYLDEIDLVEIDGFETSETELFNKEIIEEESIEEESIEETFILLSGNNNRTVEEWIEYANSFTNSSSRLNALIEAYNYYPEDSFIIEGINVTARSLLDWASSQHQAGQFSTARIRYELILNAPGLDSRIIQETTHKLAYAIQSKKFPTANQLIQLVNSTTNASSKLRFNIEGSILYPLDNRFVVGVNDTAKSLLDWASDQHLNGQYNTAIIRYNLILSAPVLDSQLRQRTETNLDYALNEKLTPDLFYKKANTATNVSSRLLLFIEGSTLFPLDKRFEEGVNTSAVSLLEWASVQHQAGNFNTAIIRYELILSTSKINNSIKKETEIKLEYALKREKIPTANQLIQLANNTSNASSKLGILVEGYILFPRDKRFEEGINENARLLLDWASAQHEAGNINTARIRYELIMNLPVIDVHILREVERKQEYAQRQEVYPSANQLIEVASNTTNASSRLGIYIDGYILYPRDKRFEEEINVTASSLLDWARGQHQAGQYNTAIIRYELILSVPVLEQSIKKATEIMLNFALNRESIPSADQFIVLANGVTNASSKLGVYVDGYILYPHDNRFEIGINSSSRSLLDWATGQHQAGNYSTAIIRYNLILSSPILDSNIKQETELKKGYALRNARIPSANQLNQLALNTINASSRLAIFTEGYLFYPNDNRFVIGINDTARNLLNWSIGEHNKRNFSSAIIRYELIISSIGVAPNIVQEAEYYLELAKDRKTIPRGPLTTYTQYNHTFNEALNIQMNRDPQTDLHNSKPAYIHSSVVDVADRGVINTGSNIRTGPSTASSIETTVPAGTVITVVRQVTGSSVSGNTIWYEIIYNGKPDLYIHSSLVNLNAKVAIVRSNNTHVREATNTSSHSWGTANAGREFFIRNTVTGSTVSGSNSNIWYDIPYIKNNWGRNAPRSDVSNFLNPNNHDIFQHLLLSSPAGATASQLNSILPQTSGNVLRGMGNVFRDAGRDFNVNEIYLVAHAMLETGNGTSTLARGVYVDSNGNTIRDSNGNLILDPSHPNVQNAVKVYNMFGIAAVDSNATNGGARYAFQRGWTTPERAIRGGAEWISNRYVNHPTYRQDTLYKMRWNPSAPGTHQYATDIGWAVKQVPRIKNLYNQLSNITIVYDIPRYR